MNKVLRNPILVIAFLALVGIGVASYLVTVHWGWWTAVCLGVGDCEAVNTSRFSEFLGLPVALWGVGEYVVLLGLSVAVWRDLYSEITRPALFLVAAVGVAFSVYLTYVEVFVIHQVCPWCVSSAILVTVIAILSGWQLWQASNTYPTVDQAQSSEEP